MSNPTVILKRAGGASGADVVVSGMEGDEPSAAMTMTMTAESAAVAENENENENDEEQTNQAELMEDEMNEDGEEEEVGDDAVQPSASDLASAFFSDLADVQRQTQTQRQQRGKRKRLSHEGDDADAAADDGAESDASSSDSEYGVRQRAAFAVPSHLAASIDYSCTDPPSTAEEYLLRVRHESAQCPRVKVASIDPSHFAHRQTSYLPKDGIGLAARPANVACLPQPDWCHSFAAQFAAARQRIMQLNADQTEMKKRVAMLMQQQQRAMIPHRRDYIAWVRYAIGDAPPADSTQLNPTTTSAAVSTTSPYSSPHLPSLSLLLSMDAVQSRGMIMQLLTYAEEQIGKMKRKWEREQKNRITPSVSNDDVAAGSTATITPAAASSPSTSASFPTHAYTLWLYSLLLKVEKPLSASLAAAIRTAYRSFSWVRAYNNDPASSVVEWCNMLLTLFGLQFGQKVEMESAPSLL